MLCCVDLGSKITRIIISFERIILLRIEPVNLLLLMQKSTMIKPRDRSSEANNRREQTFDNSTNRVFLQFERVKKEATVLHNEALDLEMKNVLHRANLASEQRQERGRDRARDRVERARGRERDDKRERGGLIIIEDDVDQLNGLINNHEYQHANQPANESANEGAIDYES